MHHFRPDSSNEKAANESAAFWKEVGGGGGNRTRVRKHSTDSSTYLALSFDLTCTTGMCTLCTSELP